jgi:hypothetical protein
LCTSWAPARDAKAMTAMHAAILLSLITVFPFRTQMQRRCGQGTGRRVLRAPRGVASIVPQHNSPKSLLSLEVHGFLTWAGAPKAPNGDWLRVVESSARLRLHKTKKP